MALILDFKGLTKKDIVLAGGKGASLGELTRFGFPVPHGFVILSTAFDKFLTKTHLNTKIYSILDKVNPEEIYAIQNASERIKALILNTEIPKDITDTVKAFFVKLDTKYVAVRSSATAEDSANAAWAGQLESFLNTTKSTLLENVRKCWASLFTPRAIAYRFSKNLHKQKISVAIVVQEMVQSKTSGIAFSVHPVTQNRNQMIIEAGFGLGEGIVSGQITPNSYVVAKKPRKIIDKTIPIQKRSKDTQQVLSDNQILELSDLILKIEKHHDFPVDVEWAHENGKFYILQSRPITTLLSPKNSYKITEREKVLAIIQRHTWNIQGFNGYPLYLHCAATKSGWMHEPIFINYTHFFYLFSKGRAYMYYDEADWKAIYKDYCQKIKTEAQLLRLERKSSQIYATVVQDAAYDKNELNKKSLEELMELARKLCNRISKSVTFAHAIEGITFGSEIKLRKILHEKKSLNEVDFSLLCLPLHRSFLFEAQKILWKIKKSKGKYRKKMLYLFLKEFSWIENTYLGAKQFNRQDIIDRANAIKQPPKLGIRGQYKKIALMDKLRFTSEERLIVKTIEICFRWQDERKKRIFQSIATLDPVLKRISKIIKYKLDDLRFSIPEEITLDRLRGKTFRKVLRDRSRGSAHFATKAGIKIFTGEDFVFFTNRLKIQFEKKIKQIKGSVANKGFVSGKVRICESVSGINRVQKNEILVASMTRPEYLPAMQKAVAFITDEGGVTCHAAIISREMNKPCIVGTKYATRLLKDGDMVAVDANVGVVTILKQIHQS